MTERMMVAAKRFLGRQRFAVVGVSRDPNDFSRRVLIALRERGLEAVPVHPAAREVDGVRCFRRLQDVEPPVEAALLLTPPALTEVVVRDALAAGVKCVWMHRGAGTGAASPRAVAFCEANGIEVVRDVCPFMVQGDAGFAHRVHAWFRRRALARCAGR